MIFAVPMMTNSVQLTVLFTGPYLTLQPGGIQTHAQNFLSAFQNHKKVSLTYFPITRGLYNNESWTKKIYRFIGSVFPFLRACKQVHVVHLNSTFDDRSLVRDCMYLLVATLIARRKVLVQFHGGMPYKATLIRYAWSRKLVQLALNRAAKILFLSRKQGVNFSTFFPGLPYQLVPNFIDCEDGDRLPQPGLRGGGPFRFVFMGRIDEKKGLREIVAAVKLLTEFGEDYEVRLIGDGPLKSWLLKQLEEHPAVAKVLRYEGPTYGQKKEETLANADAVLLPSYTEGFPYALLEAAKYGLPLISTAVGAVGEVIREGENGLLVSIGSSSDLAVKMRYLIDNPNTAAAIGQRAREMARSCFSFANLTSGFSGIYEEMAGSK